MSFLDERNVCCFAQKKAFQIFTCGVGSICGKIRAYKNKYNSELQRADPGTKVTG